MRSLILIIASLVVMGACGSEEDESGPAPPTGKSCTREVESCEPGCLKWGGGQCIITIEECTTHEVAVACPWEQP